MILKEKEYLAEIGMRSKNASKYAASLSTGEKNHAINLAAYALRQNMLSIIAANEKDIEEAKKNGYPDAFVDRLMLNEKRIESMASGLEKVSALTDPVGEVVQMRTLPNGLTVGQKRVPLGVVGIIYESRPNVTSDAFGLCLKAGNVVILKGGSAAFYSNTAIVDAIRQALSKEKINPDILIYINDTDRDTTMAMMRLNEYIDVLIPRGSAGLINSVVQNATVPVIETGVGNCHIYVDESADFEMAVNILINAKTQRTGVCNACEKLLVHQSIASAFLPDAVAALLNKKVKIIGDNSVCSLVPEAEPATDESWYTEFLDLKIGIAVVEDITQAISHIDKYGSKHSEVIVTSSYENAQRFLDLVDAAAVYVNASSRFTDGEEFGFGAEIGISTQKLHARGPMGLKELTSTKYIVYGNGQIRP